MVERQSGILSDIVSASKEEIKAAQIEMSDLPKDVEVVVSTPQTTDAAEVMGQFNIDEVNWFAKLTEEEKYNGKEGPGPRLHGLRRLAKPYIFEESSQVQIMVVPLEVIKTLKTLTGTGEPMSSSEEIGRKNLPFASVTFSITLQDGRTFCDSADAYQTNCDQLGHFPTAVASARAEARCLRKVLGIKEHAAEEMITKDPGEDLRDDDGPIIDAQAKLIEKILKDLDISLKDLLTSVTTREIHSISQLTKGEAATASSLLHDMKKKAKKVKKNDKK